MSSSKILTFFEALVFFGGVVEGGLLYAAPNRLLGLRTSDRNLLPKGFYKLILVEEPYVID